MIDVPIVELVIFNIFSNPCTVSEDPSNDGDREFADMTIGMQIIGVGIDFASDICMKGFFSVCVC